MSTPNMFQDILSLADNFGDDFITEPAMFSPNLVSTGMSASKDPLADMPSGTVSPSDLYLDASAPPSASLTDLSTPSFDSPGCFSTDPSPMFGPDAELTPGFENWEPLFEQNDALTMNFDSSVPELSSLSAELQTNASVAPAVNSVSSPVPPTTTLRRAVPHSAVAGVNASGKEPKPLKEITYDPNDPVATKRARNTAAARKSRQRKADVKKALEERNAELLEALEKTRQEVEWYKARLAEALGTTKV